MSSENLSKSIYKILLLYEDAVESKSESKLDNYISYLNRQKVRFIAIDSEIAETIEGLRIFKDSIDHKTVKSVVFHLLDIIRKRGLE